MLRRLLSRVGLVALGLATGGPARSVHAADTRIAAADFQVTTPDSVQLAVTWLSDCTEDTLPVPVAVLLPMMNNDRSSWHGMDTALTEQGFKVVSVDQRGHGASANRAGQPYHRRDFTFAEFARMADDLKQILTASHRRAADHSRSTTLDSILTGADFSNIVIIGASIGASVALQYAAADQHVRALVLLSPGMNYRGLASLPAMHQYRGRDVYLTAANGDTRSRIAVDSLYIAAFDTTGSAVARVMHRGRDHGTDLLTAHPGSIHEIIDWIVATLKLD